MQRFSRIQKCFQKIYSDFELQGVMEDKLNSKAYQTIAQRMQTEEATCALTMGQADGYVKINFTTHTLRNLWPIYQ